MEDSMPEYVKVAQASELEPNHGKLVEVQGKKIALFNVDGKFHAIDNTCTHRGGLLSEGELEGDEVTCPWHGAKFTRERIRQIEAKALRKLRHHSRAHKLR